MTTHPSPAPALQTPGVLSGNAATDDPARYGWFVGHFMPDVGDPRSTSALEVKWAVYQGGETRQGWAANREATTLAILVRGRFRLRFAEREVLLTTEGDYALWEPGVPHHWTAETATVVVTVRWPSVADDSVLVADPRPSPNRGSSQQKQ